MADGETCIHLDECPYRSLETLPPMAQFTRQTMAIILAGGRGERLGHLTDWRAKPAVPFGGKFRHPPHWHLHPVQGAEPDPPRLVTPEMLGQHIHHLP